MTIREELVRVKEAALGYGRLSRDKRRDVLVALQHLLKAEKEILLKANREDLEREGAGLSPAKRKRLELTGARIDEMVEGIGQIIRLPDPLEASTVPKRMPSGISVYQQPIPIGLVCVIFEARPNVVVDVFTLCFKAGNGCILKGGKEARSSNEALFGLIRQALGSCGITAEGIYSISSSDREVMKEVLDVDDLIDLVIPRGGEELVRFVVENTAIPVLRHAKGVCHLFLEKSGNLEKAQRVILNAKTQAPATCNALECLLLDERLPAAAVTALLEELIKHGITLRGCDESKKRFGKALFAEEMPDWSREHLDLTLNCRVVADVEEACAHIARFGTNHTEAILTEDREVWEAFRARVFSSCVLWNATTRFNDGFQLGLGAELGINTTKLHAYGPMGLESLTVKRFVVEGDYSCRR